MEHKIIAAALFLSLLPACQALAQKFQPVSNFSLEKYLGTWYEIARTPVSFEKGLNEVTADYSLRPDGKVTVVNRGVKENGKESVARGKAKFGGEKNTGYLRVSFFGPFYGDYIIVELDPDYRYALVAGSSTKYLWILCRTPKLEQETLDRLVEKAKQLGYDTSKLIFTKQK